MFPLQLPMPGGVEKSANVRFHDTQKIEQEKIRIVQNKTKAHNYSRPIQLFLPVY